MDNLMYSIAAEHICLVSFFGIWYWLHSRTKREAKIRDVIGIKTIIIIPLMAVGFQYLSVAWISVINIIAPSLVEAYAETMQEAGFDTGSPVIFIAAVCLAPIGEELIFRGMTIHYLEKTGVKFWLVNVIQALLFGVLHFNLVQGSYAFLLGLGLGLLARKYQSVIPCMLLHLCYNFLGVSSLKFIGEGNWWIAGGFVIAFVLIGIALLLLSKEKMTSRVTEQWKGLYSYYVSYTSKIYRIITHVVIPFILWPIGTIVLSIGNKSVRLTMMTGLLCLYVLVEIMCDFAGFGGVFSKESPINWIKTSGSGRLLMKKLCIQDIIIKLAKFVVGWIIMGFTPILTGNWEFALFGMLACMAVCFGLYNVSRLISIPQYMTLASLPALILCGGLMWLYSLIEDMKGLVIVYLVFLAIATVASIVVVYKRTITIYNKSFKDNGTII